MRKKNFYVYLIQIFAATRNTNAAHSIMSYSTQNSMEEHTLKLAQNLARQASLTESEADQESINTEARDGNPTPLRSMAAKLEEKVKGFR